MEPIRDLLLPSTDAGVVVQAVLAAVILGSLWWSTRDHRDVRLFVAGLTILTLAAFGMRAVH